MRKNGKTNAVGRGGALLRLAGYTELWKIFGESVCTYPRGRRGRCPHRPGRMHRFYGNLRRICNFSMGRQSCRPLQQPFALSVGADDSVCPRDVPILRESSANSQLPPTSKEVTACGFAANSRRNSLHSAGRAEPRPYQLRLHFNGFCVKQTVYGFKLMTLPFSPFFSGKTEKKGPPEARRKRPRRNEPPRYARSLLFSEPVSSSFPPNRFAGIAGNKVHSIIFNVSRET